MGLSSAMGSDRPAGPVPPAPGRALGVEVELGGGGSGGPLERLEDGPLGDAIAALEVGRRGLERGDGAQVVGQVVEDEDEVGLQEGGRGHPDVVDVGHPDRLELADGVVR